MDGTTPTTQTTLPARLVATTKAVKVTPEYQAQLEEALLPYFQKLEDWDTRIKAFKSKAIAKGIDDDDIQKAGEGRKFIQQTRIAAVRVIDAARKTIQDAMSDYKNADTLWLRAKQNVEADCKAFEAELKDIEDTRAREEAARKLELKNTRTDQISPYCDNPGIYPLGDMSEGDFQNLKAVLVQQYERLQEAEEKMRKLEEMEQQEAAIEAERLRQENDKLQRKQGRVKRLMQAGAKYADSEAPAFTWPGYEFYLLESNVADMPDDEFEAQMTEIEIQVEEAKRHEADKKHAEDLLFTQRTGGLLGDLIWRGPANGSGYIFDLSTEQIILSYKDVITMDDTAYDKIMKPFIKREVVRKEQADKRAEQEAKDNAERERKDARIQKLFAAGLAFDGENYFYGDIKVNWMEVDVLEDPEFDAKVAEVADQISILRQEEVERKLNAIDNISEAPAPPAPPVTDLPVTGSMKSRLTAWFETLKFPEPPGEYTGKGLKEVKNMRDGFTTWLNFVEERIQKL